MSRAYKLMQPFLIINLGGEMVYIIDQRLRAQNSDKSLKVLEDIISTMLDDKFMNELFKPQQMYTMVSTRKVFQKLAHSSIMKLDATSMGKLFDLMLMGMKY